jgi:steroid 5-alpha reductase family enzyme
MLWPIFGAFVGMSLVMAAGWAFQRAKDDGGWTDVFWSFGVGGVGALAALAPVPAGFAPRQALVAAMVAGWSLRLGLHIRARVLRGPEDARYAQLRRDWTPRFQARMFSFLQQQALGGGVLLVAVVLAARQPAQGLRAADLAGALILIIAVLGEGLADCQLAAFARDPANRGRVCDVDLWAWSRHPNYFFEWLGWLAYPVIAIDLAGRYPWGWAALAAPAAIYGLLRFVSGVPPLEAHMLASRGEAFRAYQARTSVFFPLPPKRSPA